MRPPIECAYPAPGNQKNLKVNTIYGIGGILVFCSREYLKRVLPYFSMAASWLIDQEVNEYDQDNNHKLQTDQLHNEEKPLNIYSNNTSVRQ